MPKEFVFLGGMPRAGSTLLANLLAQNPAIHATSTSGVMDVCFSVRNTWDKLVEFQASPNPEAKRRVLRGILESFYGDVNKPVIVDKCRGWISLIELTEYILEQRVKIIVPVRDLRGVLSSFEKLWRRASRDSQVGQESQFYFDFQTVEGRCGVWMRPDQPVGLAINRIRDALQRGYRDRLYFMRFEELTSHPASVMAGIYEFLGLAPFEHDFDRVEQVTHEDDTAFGFKALHQIRGKVEPAEPDWQTVLGPVSRKFAGPYPWDLAGE